MKKITRNRTANFQLVDITTDCTCGNKATKFLQYSTWFTRGTVFCCKDCAKNWLEDNKGF